MRRQPPGETAPAPARADWVVERVRAIPRGFVCTYGDIDPTAPRMVGLILATTRARIPWHRVVRADGSLAVGQRQLERLRREGVPLRGDRVDLRRARLPRAALDGGPAMTRSRGEKAHGAAAGSPGRPAAAAAAARAEPGSHPRVSHAAAARILALRDPVMARLVAAGGPPRLRPPHDTHFAALVRAIVHQQLAGRAAAAIHGRLMAALTDDLRPETLMALSDQALRAAGLSANKAASLRDLAAKVLDGTVVLDPAGLRRESDDEVATRLSSVRGIGRWTADMFLLFQLRRLDVWPTGDFGVRRGYGLAWGVDMPSARELASLGDPFRPYRSAAAWYCWRAVELYAGAAGSAVTR
jgi:DNA-3-methyladenine glycosylase II